MPELIQNLDLHRRVDIAEENIFCIAVRLRQTGNKAGENVEMKLNRIPHVKILMVPAAPVKRRSLISSQALKILKDAGLVAEHAVGTRRIYQLNPTAVAALRDQLDTYWSRALATYGDVVDRSAKEAE